MSVRSSCVRMLLVALAVSAGVPLDAAAQRLGRLLTSAEERAALDALRRQARIEQPAPPPAPAPEPPPVVKAPPAPPAGPSISRLQINGVVRRSGGGTGSVWVNGDLIERGSLSRDGVAVESDRGLAGSVRLRLPSGTGTVALRPGQQIDIDSGALLEVYEKRRTEDKASAFVPRHPAGGQAPADAPAGDRPAADGSAAQRGSEDSTPVPAADAPPGSPDGGQPADAVPRALLEQPAWQDAISRGFTVTPSAPAPQR